jgi:hypothetical protein
MLHKYTNLQDFPRRIDILTFGLEAEKGNLNTLNTSLDNIPSNSSLVRVETLKTLTLETSHYTISRDPDTIFAKLVTHQHISDKS